MVANQSFIIAATESLTHEEACRLSKIASRSLAASVLLDLSRTTEAWTPAFARLVLLRSELLRAGGDLRIVGLRGQPARLFEVHRLENVLPRINEFTTARTVTAARRSAPTPLTVNFAANSADAPEICAK